MTGRFITFEGGEGTGKSTQARLLAQRLRASEVANHMPFPGARNLAMYD